VLPQAYTGDQPGKLQRLSKKFWGKFGKTMVMGLSGMKAVTPAEMRADLKATDDLGVEEVYYWSFANLRANSARLAVVRDSAARARATRPHLPPPALCEIV
jgi:hypothetical protein